MRIATASFHNCIRVFKQIVGLERNDIEVHTLLHHMANSDLRDHYDSLSFYGNPDNYAEKIAKLRDIDLIHVHNEPNWLGTVAKRVKPDMPVVFDAHDLDSVRQGQILDDERECFERLDGFIFPSQGYADICKDLYNLPEEACRVIYSMCNEHMIIENPLPKLAGICYEGGIEALPPDQPDFMGRDYRKIACYLRDWGIPFTVFGANGYYVEHYVPTGTVCFPPHNYYHMLEQMSRYDWGLVGNEIKCSQRKHAMPNKLFEYMAAGIPAIVMNAEEAGKFVEEHGVGVYIEDIDEIQKIYPEHEKYKMTVLAKRHMFTMEKQMPDILSLYEYAKENCDAKSTAAGSAPGLGECGTRVCNGSEGCRCAFCDGVSR
jgi:hypothetical protein